MTLPRSILLLLSFLLPCLAPAQEAEEAPDHPLQPLLWKVEGGELEEPSYLFGTIHLGKGPIGNLHPAAERAIEASDAVHTEVPMDAATQMGMAKHFVRSDGRKLSESIGEELTTRLETELRAINPQLGIATLESFKTWAVAVTMPLLKAQLNGTRAVDAIVWNQAEELGKATGALEKPADQAAIFDDLAEEEQIVFLSESLRQMKQAREAGEDPVDDLMNAYIAGDPERLDDEMERQLQGMAEGEHRELGERLMSRLLDERNVTMAATMIDRMTAEPGRSFFFAVGAGHYVGDGNIRDILTEKGYTVTRVTE